MDHTDAASVEAREEIETLSALREIPIEEILKAEGESMEAGSEIMVKTMKNTVKATPTPSIIEMSLRILLIKLRGNQNI